MTDRPGDPPEGRRFRVGADGKAVLVPDVLGPEDRIKLPNYAQWRSAILRRVGDGSELYDALMELVAGVTRIAVYPEGHERAGQPIEKPHYSSKGYLIGGEEIAIVVPPSVRLAAARELLDRAFGKPVQVVIDATPADQEPYSPAEELSDSEAAVLRELAKRRMLGRVPHAEAKADDADEA